MSVPGTRRLRLLPCAALLVALSVLPSCFTAALWGGEYTIKQRYDSCTGQWVDEGVWEFDLGSPGVDGFLARLLLTPFTLCLDCATGCVQAWLFDDDDDRCPPGSPGGARGR